MWRLLAKRLLLLPVSIFALVTLCFALVQIVPGDPAVAVAGTYANAQEVERVRGELGLDRPWNERYLGYLGQLARGDLGRSLFSGQPIIDEVKRRLPATVQLVTLSLALSIGLGLLIGGLGAYFRYTWIDTAARSTITLVQSIPDFLLSLILIFLLFFVARLAPAPVGQMGFATGYQHYTGFTLIDTLISGNLALFGTALSHLALPVLSLGIVYSAHLGRVGRTALAKALSSRQVEFARACGLPEWRVLQYAFMDARTPIITYSAILFGALVGGASIVETIFAWDGIGQWGLESILRLDLPVIQAVILVTGTFSICVFLLLDVLVLILDPRVRYA